MASILAATASGSSPSIKKIKHEGSQTKSSARQTSHSYDRPLLDNDSFEINSPSVAAHSGDGPLDLPFRRTPPALGDGNTRIDENQLRMQMELNESTDEFKRNLRADQAELRRQANTQHNNLGRKY